MTASSPRAPHPFLYTILVLPYGLTSGYVTVTLAFLATKSGLSVAQGAEMIAVMLFPQTWKFLLAPIVDLSLGRRRWYLISCILCAAGMFVTAASPLGPATLRFIDAVIFATSIASSFLGFALEGMIAHLTIPSERGRVSAWYQAGNMAGGGFGGALGLWLFSHLPFRWESGLVLGALTLGCAAVLPWMPVIPADPTGTSAADTVRKVSVDFWDVLRSRTGILCAALCFVPVGTGAASGVLAQAEVAAKWGAGEGSVELVQGLLSGVMCTVGSFAGGYGCIRLGGRLGYLVFGGVMAVSSVAMAVLPMTPFMYIAGNLVYLLANGLCYAAFSCVVLETIGANNGATKYNGFASLSNVPIWYMGLVLAAFEERMGPKGMLLAEAGFAAVGILTFALVAGFLRPRAASVAATA